MLTVKEFKDFGGEFVAGDFVTGFLLDGGGAGYLNASGTFDSKNVAAFAWRPMSTLPDNPRFKFEQDFFAPAIRWRPLLDQSSTSKPYDFAYHVSNQTIFNCKCEQVEIKPVFTQAMADSGELPPVGSKCIAYIESDGEECEIVRFHQDDVCVIWEEFNDSGIDIISTTSWKFKPIDTRTPSKRRLMR